MVWLRFKQIYLCDGDPEIKIIFLLEFRVANTPLILAHAEGLGGALQTTSTIFHTYIQYYIPKGNTLKTCPVFLLGIGMEHSTRG